MMIDFFSFDKSINWLLLNWNIHILWQLIVTFEQESNNWGKMASDQNTHKNRVWNGDNAKLFL